ncbi:MAG: glycosyltransferase, partial [Chitinispirillaceae bacterium]|nr:glycosyltransferase [Chitinispirillaceae bacterium]
MAPVKVAHIVYSWLPVTQNWVFTQLRFNDACVPTVVSMTGENEGQFPVERRFTAFPSTFAGSVGLFMARYWIRQPAGFLRTVLAGTAPDIIHGHFSHESWRILPMARSMELPLITTFYGLDVDKLPRRKAWKRRYKELFSYGTRFLVEGPFMGKRLEAIGCPAEKIRVVALGIDRSLYGAAQRTGSKNGDPVKVLFTGLGREKKGAPDAAATFINAARRQPRLELHLIGDGGYRPKVERMLREAQLLHRAVFHGYVPFDRYRSLLFECDIVLVPSRYAKDGDCEGGAPVVCIEALASGVPVVGTRHCD